ncbi:quinone oxidoreductase family protein [Geodermatophilus marinus]|uniref:quinone oxidoreductase family protein n=1 Tax=Geodermatophilus sp. LHW52908 TaxID=2303986 RepID=UPI000E3C9DD2|nr:zinc-binding alcohol dehydrogenase family protein [Geodermatophilus sp. LHW52908]RFU21521.1 zinc-binding alcohol dehydrogenase family protein [Geodermatophilus sp. LHW52908]
MRAAVLTTPGQPPAHTDHPDPSAGEGRTLVRVTAAPVVPLDLLCASGTSYFGRPATPYVPGVQGVGVVEESARVAPGTRVWFATSAGMAPGDGSLAELCAVPDADVVPVAAAVDDAPLAALGLSAVAAWMALSRRGRLRRGETVLVLGAGGAVGQAGVAAARELGAGRVVAACRPGRGEDRARAAGADAVVPLTGDADDLAARLAEAAGGRFDVVLDPVFGVPATAAGRVLAEGGRLVNLGGAAGDSAEFSSAVLRGRSADVLGYTNNALTPPERADALTAVAEVAAAGRMAVAHEVRPLAEVAAAWDEQAAGRTSARLVLSP